MNTTSVSLYNRRRNTFTKSRSYYINISNGSRDSLDDETTDDSASITSTKSQRSFKSWKKSQRNKRRKLERTQSLLDSLDLKDKIFTSRASKRNDYNEHGSADQLQITNENKPFITPSQERLKRLSTITQSPPEEIEVYYSSSPLTTSSDDSDAEASARIQQYRKFQTRKNFNPKFPTVSSIKEDSETKLPGLNSVVSILSKPEVESTSNIMSASTRPQIDTSKGETNSPTLPLESDAFEVTNDNINTTNELYFNSSQDLSSIISVNETQQEPSLPTDMPSPVVEAPLDINHSNVKQEENAMKEDDKNTQKKFRCDLNSNVKSESGMEVEYEKGESDITENVDNEADFENMYLENSQSLMDLVEDPFYDETPHKTSSPKVNKQDTTQDHSSPPHQRHNSTDPIESVLVRRNSAEVEATTFTRNSDEAKVTSLRRGLSLQTADKELTNNPVTSPSEERPLICEVKDKELQKTDNEELTKSGKHQAIHNGIDCCIIL